MADLPFFVTWVPLLQQLARRGDGDLGQQLLVQEIVDLHHRRRGPGLKLIVELGGGKEDVGARH